MRTKIGAMMGK